MLILVLGTRAIFQLPVSQYPKTESAIITVSTTYLRRRCGHGGRLYHAAAEAAISQARHRIHVLVSSTGVSVIMHLRLNYDSNRALTEINHEGRIGTQPAAAPGAAAGAGRCRSGQSADTMYIGYFSDTLPINGLSDYLVRVIKAQSSTAIEGVQTAEVIGTRLYALRAWLDPTGWRRMESPPAMSTMPWPPTTSCGGGYYQGGKWSRLTSRLPPICTPWMNSRSWWSGKQDGAIIRLEDVANVVLGLRITTSAWRSPASVRVHWHTGRPLGKCAAGGGQSEGSVAGIEAQLPVGMTQKLAYDATLFIDTSIKEVLKTLTEALIIVTVVIYLFLGTLRAVVIPVVAMPLSLVGRIFPDVGARYSINLLTLLALVLRDRLVVDDAIIVVENVDRHLKAGLSPFNAALQGARELGGRSLR